MEIEAYYLNNKNYVFKHDNSYYIHNEDIYKNIWSKEKISDNYWKLINFNDNILKKIGPYELPNFEYIEFVFEIKNIKSLVKLNNIRFINFNNASYSNDCRKTKIYNIKTSFTKKKIEIEFKEEEISLAVHLLDQNLENIMYGDFLFIHRDVNISIDKIIYNNEVLEKLSIDEILDKKRKENLILIEFNKEIEEKSNLVVLIDDKYTYRPKIANFLVK